MTFPIWMYFVVAGIFFSAFMTVKTSSAERRAEQEYIEQEGDIYMQRLAKEREERNNTLEEYEINH
ncbi:hypothetical protein JOC78_000538 [Bacillus ectoiniformans]|uniref:sporulation YhaL family protein n=1 Tax=Bacillus ectoiniformans TaxID=1494429 RepID=UPI00195ACF93|nr:sporulation YhaL family protein [Bacillus ectoiniformans]MBM7647617.1 hypothetical protein [Bacillus ectoiniformans]